MVSQSKTDYVIFLFVFWRECFCFILFGFFFFLAFVDLPSVFIFFCRLFFFKREEREINLQVGEAERSWEEELGEGRKYDQNILHLKN